MQAIAGKAQRFKHLFFIKMIHRRSTHLFAHAGTTCVGHVQAATSLSLYFTIPVLHYLLYCNTCVLIWYLGPPVCSFVVATTRLLPICFPDLQEHQPTPCSALSKQALLNCRFTQVQAANSSFAALNHTWLLSWTLAV